MILCSALVRAGRHLTRTAHKAYSTAQSQHVQITRSGGHHVNIYVFEPTVKQHHDKDTARTSVLLYFPRGPVQGDTDAEEATLAMLCATLTSSHIVQMRHQVGSAHQHPQQIYDALATFDWAVEHILPERSIKRHGRAARLGRIATCGELYGGGLATMLALTECKIRQHGISAVAVNNPVVDWSQLSCRPSKQRKTMKPGLVDESTSSASLTAELSAVRQSMFRHEKAKLDAFASPILLFRSPGLTELPRSAVEQTGANTDESLAEVDTSEDSTATSGCSESSDSTDVRGPRYSYQFPSRSLHLKLPACYITTGSVEPLHSQGLELAKQMEKSVSRQSRPSRRKVTSQDESWIYDHEDNEHGPKTTHAKSDTTAVLYNSTPGLSLWDRRPKGQASLKRAAQWLHGQLNPIG